MGFFEWADFQAVVAELPEHLATSPAWATCLAGGVAQIGGLNWEMVDRAASASGVVRQRMGVAESCRCTGFCWESSSADGRMWVRIDAKLFAPFSSW